MYLKKVGDTNSRRFHHWSEDDESESERTEESEPVWYVSFRHVFVAFGIFLASEMLVKLTSMLVLRGFESQCELPPLLLVCKESNAIGRTLYNLSFGSPYSCASTWFNFDIDTLYLDWGYECPPREWEEEVPENVFSFYPKDISDISKVKNLAIWTSDELCDVGKWFDQILGAFGNVRNFTLVRAEPLEQIYGNSNLVFLEHAEMLEQANWLPLPGDNFTETHRLLKQRYPGLFLENGFNIKLWASSEDLWNSHEIASEMGGILESDSLQWSKPLLYCKPIMAAQGKLKFLEDIQEFNEFRMSTRVAVTLESANYDPVEVSVPLTTTFIDLVLMFCQARGTEFKAGVGVEATVLAEQGFTDTDFVKGFVIELGKEKYERFKLYHVKDRWYDDGGKYEMTLQVNFEADGMFYSFD